MTMSVNEGMYAPPAAIEAWEAAREKVPNRKLFYEERYAVPNAVDTYRKVAALMRSLDRIPQELRDLGTELELLAASQH